MFKRFLKSSSIFFFGKILMYVVTFFLLPIYTRKIPTGSYGYYELSSTIMSLAVSVTFFEIWTAILKYSLNDEKKNKTVISSASFLALISSLILIILMIGANAIFHFEYFWYIFALAITFALSNIFMYLSRAIKANIIFVISGISGTLIGAIVGILGIYVFNLSVEAMYLSMIVNYLVQILIIVFAVRVWKYISIDSIDKEMCKKIIKFSWPLALNSVIYYFSTQFNKVIINTFLGNEQVGIFTVAGKFLAISSVFFSVFQLAWQEISFSMGDRADKAKIYSIVIEIVTICSAIFAILFIPFINVVFPFFIGRDYIDAKNIIPIYYTSIFFSTINAFLVEILTNEEKNVTKLVIRFIGMIASLILSYTLINFIQLQGIVISTVATEFIVYLLFSIYLFKRFNVKFNLLYLFAFIIIYIPVGYIFLKCNVWVNLATLLILGILSLVVVYFLWKKRFEKLIKLK